MSDKDIQEKTLEAYNDVFADIVNVLLFEGRQVIHHVHETLQLMSALTKDNRFEEECNSIEKGAAVTMCEVLDRMINKGREEGILTGRIEGRAEAQQETLLASLKNVIQSLNISVERAMDILKVPEQDRSKYAQLLRS